MNLLRVDDAARMLAVSRARVYELVREGGVPVIRLGRRQLRFSQEALETWVEAGGTREVRDERKGSSDVHA